MEAEAGIKQEGRRDTLVVRFLSIMKVVIDTKAVVNVTTQYVLPAVGGLMGFLLAASPLKALQVSECTG